jgi:hypothetical protein
MRASCCALGAVADGAAAVVSLSRDCPSAAATSRVMSDALAFPACSISRWAAASSIL